MSGYNFTEDDEFTAEELSNHVGVDYLEMGSKHCKALLEQRSGDWNLHMVCGRQQMDGFPYCRKHVRLFYNLQHLMRYGYGQTSQRA